MTFRNSLLTFFLCTFSVYQAAFAQNNLVSLKVKEFKGEEKRKYEIRLQVIVEDSMYAVPTPVTEAFGDDLRQDQLFHISSWEKRLVQSASFAHNQLVVDSSGNVFREYYEVIPDEMMPAQALQDRMMNSAKAIYPAIAEQSSLKKVVHHGKEIYLLQRCKGRTCDKFVRFEFDKDGNLLRRLFIKGFGKDASDIREYSGWVF